MSELYPGPDPYIGRFAPSPTGPLHFGSLVAAVASYLDAKHHSGKWLLRIEDLDPPRESKSAVAEILFALEKYGLQWDEEILFQSRCHDQYQSALDNLLERNLLYPCTCSRKRIDGVYDKQCIAKDFTNSTADFAIRVKTDQREISIKDRILGRKRWLLDEEVGDFIIKRKDGLFAYQLAVVVDDASQNINQIVRGADILDSTPRQNYLQQLLGLETPGYAHVPIIIHPDGSKLSKQTGAPPIDVINPTATLLEAIRVLGQTLPGDALNEEPSALLARASKDWDINKIPKVFELSPD